MELQMLDLYLVHLFLLSRYLDLIYLLSTISAPPPYNKGSATRRDLPVEFLDMLELSPTPHLRCFLTSIEVTLLPESHDQTSPHF